MANPRKNNPAPNKGSVISDNGKEKQMKKAKKNGVCLFSSVYSWVLILICFIGTVFHLVDGMSPILTIIPNGLAAILILFFGKVSE